jgi:cold shock CspA family protein
MQTKFKIDSHGAVLSEALQYKIADHVADLERMYGRLTACHVSLEPPGHHQRKGGLFHVSIHLALPDGREVSAGATPTADKRHSNVLFALNDAFRRARRQLQDHARKMRGQVKIHGTQPSGTVIRFDPQSGFGFIEAEDGHEVYFHKNSMIGGRPSQIRRGARVTFVEEIGEKGPQASTVRRLGKHAMR